MMRKSSPSIWISVPEYFPYNTVSPIFTVTGSSFFPGPAATTVPRCGFSFAVSGIMIPPAVFSSAGAGFTITLSCSGVTLNFLAIVVLIFVLMKDGFDERFLGSRSCIRQECKGKPISYQTPKQGHFYSFWQAPGPFPGGNVNIAGRQRLFGRRQKWPEG
jgi:hypothetical protein